MLLSDFELTLAHVDAYHTHFEPSNRGRYDSTLNTLHDSKPMSSQSDISLKVSKSRKSNNLSLSICLLVLYAT